MIKKNTDSLQTDKLVYQIENSQEIYSATRLGRTTSFSGLSARSAALFGAFLRAMVSLSEKHRAESTSTESILRRISDLDLLVLCLASYEARDMLLPLSKDEQREITQYIEALPTEEKPVLNLWRDPNSELYPTSRLISTLRLSSEEVSRSLETFWRLFRTGSMLLEHARGRRIEELRESYGCHDGDIEGRLKPTVCWLLNALAQICTGDRCYKLDFLAIRAFELMQALTVGGPLGKLMNVKGIGIKTIETLAASGVRSLSELAGKPTDFLERMALGKSQTEALKRFLVRHQR
jgi:hypothetical protein